MVIESLTEEDIARLGMLQVSLLPGSMTARFGTAYARSFYRYVMRSGNEIVLVRRSGSQIVAFCVVSLKPQTLLRRLVIRTPLIVHALPRMITPRLWGLIINVIRSKADGSADAFPPALSTLPELMMLGCAPQYQGQGHASLLVEESEAALRARNYSGYLVRTFDDDDNLAVKFYLQRGFSVVARFVAHGTPFRLMRKPLCTDSASDNGVLSRHP